MVYRRLVIRRITLAVMNMRRLEVRRPGQIWEKKGCAKAGLIYYEQETKQG
jgi:hypothetical protein